MCVPLVSFLFFFKSRVELCGEVHQPSSYSSIERCRVLISVPKRPSESSGWLRLALSPKPSERRKSTKPHFGRIKKSAIPLAMQKRENQIQSVTQARNERSKAKTRQRAQAPRKKITTLVAAFINKQTAELIPFLSLHLANRACGQGQGPLRRTRTVLAMTSPWTEAAPTSKRIFGTLACPMRAKSSHLGRYLQTHRNLAADTRIHCRRSTCIHAPWFDDRPGAPIGEAPAMSVSGKTNNTTRHMGISHNNRDRRFFNEDKNGFELLN